MMSYSQIDAETKKLFDSITFTDEPKGLYDPLRYMISIGGKRIRPRLCLLAWSIFGTSLSEEILEPAAALEVFHTFTLIHDDIMDRSPLRRGRETVWKKWNSDTAILSGDVMQIDAYRRICKAPAGVRGKILDLFTRTAAQVCEGQQYDMDFENRQTVEMEEYEKMIGLKTAVLIACAAKMGAVLGGASDSEADALYMYGYKLGMAFQIADDWLDAYGDEKVFGKPIGGDIINGKKSWLTVRAMEKDPDSLLKALGAKAETGEEKKAKITSVKALYDSLGVSSDAKAEVSRYSREAMEALHGLDIPSVKLEELEKFDEELVGRAK